MQNDSVQNDSVHRKMMRRKIGIRRKGAPPMYREAPLKLCVAASWSRLEQAVS